MNKNVYSAVVSALIPCTLHVKGSRGANASNLACLHVLLGEKVRQHEMTLCDFWLRGYLSSIQCHGLPKIRYVNLANCAFYCYLIRESNDMFKNSLAL